MKKQDNQREAVLYAYLAGIIDGEGTIRIGYGKTGTKYYAAIGVGMSSKPIVELLRNTFTPSGTIWIERVPSRKIMYRWGTSGNKVIPSILDKILPYLIEKREQAILLKQFCKPQVKAIAKCFECGKSPKWLCTGGLCNTCSMRLRRAGTLEDFKKSHPIRSRHRISELELQRREELYVKVKKLNAVGALATTK